MFKALGRQFQKKQDYLIVVHITKVSAAVEEDCQVQVVWKRGTASTETGAKVDLNNIETDAELNDVFKKVSSFYSKDNGNIFEPKMCSFEVVVIDSDENEKVIASKEVDMAPFVNHTDSFQKIDFEESELPNTYIELEWTITSDTSGRDDTTRMSITGSSLGGALDQENLQIGGMSINEFLEKAQKLEEEKQDIEQQFDLVLNAKKSLEQTLTNERKERDELKEKLKMAEEALEQAQSAPADDGSKQAKLNDQLNYLVDLIKASSDKAAEAKKETEEQQADLKKQCETLSAQMTEEADRYQTALKALGVDKDAEIAHLKKALDDVQTAAASGSKKDAAANAIIKAKNSEIESLKTQLSTVKSELASAAAQSNNGGASALMATIPIADPNDRVEYYAF